MASPSWAYIMLSRPIPAPRAHMKYKWTTPTRAIIGYIFTRTSILNYRQKGRGTGKITTWQFLPMPPDDETGPEMFLLSEETADPRNLPRPDKIGRASCRERV